ncbi:hypothetical protein CF328_g9075 [Tilletia controversa]|nr:hypothetical protein CF328_g9075 [Tilletia controversa]
MANLCQPDPPLRQHLAKPSTTVFTAAKTLPTSSVTGHQAQAQADATKSTFSSAGEKTKELAQNAVATGVGPSSSSTASAANMSARQKAALASAYEELGKELHASSALKTVGNYTLGRPIAEGTFGKVSLATHRLTNTRVAIKQIPKSHSSHAAAALTRETHHHRKLHHPHVTQLYEVLVTESSIWMVSELCAGGELYDYLVERGTLPDAEARRLFGQLCLSVTVDTHLNLSTRGAYYGLPDILPRPRPQL